MKTHKTELASAINRLKAAVSKNSPIPTAHCMLVNHGWLEANNLDLAARIQMPGSECDYFIIPPEAFDMINKLPNVDIEVEGDDKTITIKAGKVKTAYQTYDPDLFNKFPATENENSVKIAADDLLGAISNVSFAIADSASNPAMGCVFLHSANDRLNVVGLDGHVIAYDMIDYPGTDFEMLIRKEHFTKLPSLGISDEVEIIYGKNVACFKSPDIDVVMRLVDKKYFAYDQMFKLDVTYSFKVDKADLTDALIRAKLGAGDKKPVVFTFTGNRLDITIRDDKHDYLEELAVDGNIDDFQIAFNPALLVDAMKSFDSDVLSIDMANAKAPIIIKAENEAFKSLVLPVNITKKN